MENTILMTQLSAKDYASFFEKGISYNEYVANMTQEVENNVESKYAQYIPMNLQRTKRVGKTTHLGDDVVETLTSLPHTINWLLISEHWCGDVSQTAPIINAFASTSNGMIDLRIVYRDENPDLIDAHLTNGGRAIPKLIQLDADFNITGVWGPRPAAAQKLVVELRANPLTADIYQDLLHKWYAEDKTVSTQMELLTLLKTAL